MQYTSTLFARMYSITSSIPSFCLKLCTLCDTVRKPNSLGPLRVYVPLFETCFRPQFDRWRPASRQPWVPVSAPPRLPPSARDGDCSPGDDTTTDVHRGPTRL